MSVRSITPGYHYELSMWKPFDHKPGVLLLFGEDGKASFHNYCLAYQMFDCPKEDLLYAISQVTPVKWGNAHLAQTPHCKCCEKKLPLRGEYFKCKHCQAHCIHTFYCSQQCQTLHWKLHKLVCISNQDVLECFYHQVDAVMGIALTSGEIPQGMKRYRDSLIATRKPEDRTRVEEEMEEFFQSHKHLLVPEDE